MSSPTLDADQWRAVFNRLSRELPSTSKHHVKIIGGVAIALLYAARRTTDDADVILPEGPAASEVLDAAARVAPEFGLQPNWMNEKAKDANLLVLSESAGRTVFDSPSLVLETPSIEHLLAMKVTAFRDDADIDDAKLLLAEL